MFTITDNSDGEVCINYQGDGRQWLLVMMQAEEKELFQALGQRQLAATTCDELETCERCPLCKNCDYCGPDQLDEDE